MTDWSLSHFEDYQDCHSHQELRVQEWRRRQSHWRGHRYAHTRLQNLLLSATSVFTSSHPKIVLLSILNSFTSSGPRNSSDCSSWPSVMNLGSSHSVLSASARGMHRPQRIPKNRITYSLEILLWGVSSDQYRYKWIIPVPDRRP